MAKIVKKKLVSKTKKIVQKPKIITEVKVDNLEKNETAEETQSSPVLLEAESIPLAATNDLSQNLLQLNNNTNMETKTESVPETALIKEEVVGQAENIPEITADTIVPPEEKPKKPFPTIILVLIAFVLGILLGGFVVYKKDNIFAKKNQENKPAVVEKQEQISPTSIPTEAPVDLKKYSIEILNGTKTSGVAGKLKESLVKEGFDVLNTGNATNSSFTKSVLKVKKETDKQYLKKLQDFLLNTYSFSEPQDLGADEKTDVVFIIGAE